MDDSSKVNSFIRVKHKNVSLVEEKLRDIHNVFAVKLEKIVSKDPRPRINPRFVLFSLECRPGQNLDVLLYDVQVNFVHTFYLGIS